MELKKHEALLLKTLLFKQLLVKLKLKIPLGAILEMIEKRKIVQVQLILKFDLITKFQRTLSLKFTINNNVCNTVDLQQLQ